MEFIKCRKCGAVVRTSDDMCPNCAESLSGNGPKYLKLGKLSVPGAVIVPAIITILFFAVFVLMFFNVSVIYEKFAQIFVSTFNDFFNFLFFVIIFSLFLWAIVSFRLNVSKTRRNLNEAYKALKGIDGKNISKKFAEIDKFFSNSEFFKIQWREFSQTLRKEHNDGDDKYYVTTEIYHFFNEDSLFFNRFLSSFVFSVPAILTGIGIFGTFFGLVIGLQPFQSVADFSDSAEVGKLTSQLLGGISTSFLSSLWGMAFSLISNFLLAHAKSHICNQIDSFVERLEALFPRSMSSESEVLLMIKNEIEKNSLVMKNAFEKGLK